MPDPRASAARYYDLDPDMPKDVPFYIGRLPSAAARVLELGCGTGRVTVPLARHCARIRGLDHSEGMLAICRDRLRATGIGNATVSHADITDVRLEQTFDYIIAPYRVLQNLASDREVHGLLAGIRRHLAPGGRCILNTFRVKGSRADLIARWSDPREELDWEVSTNDGRITCHVYHGGIDEHPLVLHPELRYRRYRGAALVDEARLGIVMRCYEPDELLALIDREGFRVTRTFGGYAGEAYGEGGELVVEFEGDA